MEEKNWVTEYKLGVPKSEYAKLRSEGGDGSEFFAVFSKQTCLCDRVEKFHVKTCVTVIKYEVGWNEWAHCKLERRKNTGSCLKNLNGRDKFGDLEVNGSIILR